MRGRSDHSPRGTTRGALALGLLAAAACASVEPTPLPAQQTPQQPRLVVTVVIDQLRGDLIEHYEPAFEGGFRRLLDQGMVFTQASHAHARTSTAPGHATLTTGVVPARHGVIANSWYQRRGFTWQNTYAVEDPDSPILGFENEPLLPGRSPRTMIRDGLPDWMGAANPDSRRVSISKKDRAAVPMGGRNTEHVYWILPELARFITSTHYRKDYPGWLERFNREVMPGLWSSRVWESEVPEAHRHLARRDSAAYEYDGVHTAFPHRSVDENPDTTLSQHYVWASELPFADDAVMALAATAIDELELGQRDDIDYLAISLSATDRVGHQFGPFSQESFSTLVHVDRLLGDFFELLDREVGAGRWVLGLSGDHGVVTIPEYARELGVAHADRIPTDSVLTTLSGFLNEEVRGGGTEAEIAGRVGWRAHETGVAEAAYTHHDLMVGGAPADSFSVLYRNSYYPGRAWDLLSRWGVDLRFGEDDYIGFPTGTNHETVYWYDRWVPMMFLGSGVRAGTTDTHVYTVDFAPTLAGLAGIPVPDDLDGRRIF